MQNFLQRVFRIRGGEATLVITLSLLLLGNTAARQMSGIVGISDLINTGGVNQTLVVNAINGVLIFITAMIASLIVDRFNRVELVKWTCFTFAIVFIVLRLLTLFTIPEKFIAAMVYLMSQQQWLIFPMFFWVLTNDIFELSQAKRLIPVIGSWAFAGKVLGIGLMLLPALLFRLGMLSVETMTLEIVTLANVAVYLLAFLLISVGLRNVNLREQTQQGEESLKDIMTEGWGFVREVPSFRFLLLAVLGIAMCDVLIEFRFFAVAKGEIADPVQYKHFYSTYLLVAAIVSFAIQGFVTSRIVQRFQLKNTFLIQPIIALLTGLALILSPEIVAATTGSLLLKISRNTVDESTRKSFQGFVPEERRGRVALLMDNYVPAIGMVLAASIGYATVMLSALAGIADRSFYIYLGISALAAGFAIWSISRMRAVYDASFLNWRLKRRKRGVDVLKKLEFTD